MTGDAPVAASLSSERRDELIEKMARRIEAWGLTTPAILMLEAHKPLSFIGSQAILVLQPLLSIAVDPSSSSDIAALLEDRNNVELLIRRLEERENYRAGTAA